MNELIQASDRDVVIAARSKVLNLENTLRAMETVDLPLQHFFARGVYLRQLELPKDTVLVGMIHKYSQINILLKGEMSVLTETGVRRIKAPFVFESPPGVKRAGYAHEDSIWATIHGTQETDLDKLEDQLIAKSFEEFDQLCLEETKWLGSQ